MATPPNCFGGSTAQNLCGSRRSSSVLRIRKTLPLKRCYARADVSDTSTRLPTGHTSTVLLPTRQRTGRAAAAGDGDAISQALAQPPHLPLIRKLMFAAPSQH